MAGLSYQDVGMVNDSLDSLARTLVAKRAAAREAARDKAEESYRGQVLTGNQAEAAANREFRTQSAAAEKSHQDRLAGSQAAHFKTVEEQNAERNSLLKTGQQERNEILKSGQSAKQNAERNERMQKHLDWLKDGVAKEIIPADQANKLLQSTVGQMDIESLVGTPFEHIGPNFFQAPPKKVKERGLGRLKITTDEDGKTTRTIERDLEPEDEQTPDEPDVLQSSLKEAEKAKKAARVAGDKKAEADAQARIDRVLVMMEEESTKAPVWVRDSKTGQLVRMGGGTAGKAGPDKPAAPVKSVTAAEDLPLPGTGTYTTTPVTENDIPEIVTQRARVKDLETQLHNMGSSAPQRVPVPVYGMQAGGVDRPTNASEKQAHDSKVRDLLRRLAVERQKLEQLRSRK